MMIDMMIKECEYHHDHRKADGNEDDSENGEYDDGFRQQQRHPLVFCSIRAPRR